MNTPQDGKGDGPRHLDRQTLYAIIERVCHVDYRKEKKEIDETYEGKIHSRMTHQRQSIFLYKLRHGTMEVSH